MWRVLYLEWMPDPTVALGKAPVAIRLARLSGAV
jgi:hypothetical protein